MADTNPTADALKAASGSLKNAVAELSKARERSKTATDHTKELDLEIGLIYDECRDIYTRLAGLCADAELAPPGTGR